MSWWPIDCLRAFCVALLFGIQAMQPENSNTFRQAVEAPWCGYYQRQMGKVASDAVFQFPDLALGVHGTDGTPFRYLESLDKERGHAQYSSSSGPWRCTHVRRSR